jgi:hypothetical protein
MTFLCEIPGVDAATAAWHSVVHLGLTVVVTLSGTGFLARALVVYRRTAPARTAPRAISPGNAATHGAGPPSAHRAAWAHAHGTGSTAR